MFNFLGCLYYRVILSLFFYCHAHDQKSSLYSNVYPKYLLLMEHRVYFVNFRMIVKKHYNNKMIRSMICNSCSDLTMPRSLFNKFHSLIIHASDIYFTSNIKCELIIIFFVFSASQLFCEVGLHVKI